MMRDVDVFDSDSPTMEGSRRFSNTRSTTT